MNLKIAHPSPLGGVEAQAERLAEARARTLRLVEAVSDTDLDRVHDPLMSPLVWDLGPMAAFEDLWVCRETDLDLLRPDLAETYDAFETPRSDRGELAYLRRDQALAYMDGVRARTLSVLGRVDEFFTDDAALFGLAFASPRPPAG